MVIRHRGAPQAEAAGEEDCDYPGVYYHEGACLQLLRVPQTNVIVVAEVPAQPGFQPSKEPKAHEQARQENLDEEFFVFLPQFFDWGELLLNSLMS